MITRRGLLKTTFGLTAGLGLYSWQFEPHWVEIVERQLPITHLPRNMTGKRLVQLSDLHIGPWVDDDYLKSAFDKVRALSPDIVVYTGDFTSHASDVLAHANKMFEFLPTGRLSTLGILGNHDYGLAWGDEADVSQPLSALASQAGIRVLRNEMVVVNGLQIVGLDDLWAGRFEPKKALAEASPNLATLALSHNPDTVDQPDWEHFQGWILSGHTHGGQCKPPFLPPPIVPVQNRRYIAGAYALTGNRHLYINRGLGHLLQVRCNARPEITVFHLA